MGKPISIDTRLFNFKWIDIRWSKLYWYGRNGYDNILYNKKQYFKHEKVNQQVCLSANFNHRLVQDDLSMNFP